MKNYDGEWSFDCMKWLRETRDRIHEETKDMSMEERLWRLERRPTHPVLAELFDRRITPDSSRRRSTVPAEEHGGLK